MSKTKLIGVLDCVELVLMFGLIIWGLWASTTKLETERDLTSACAALERFDPDQSTRVIQKTDRGETIQTADNFCP